ncbi:MAG: phosphoglucosamine mutase, partial [Clostridia bacterium]|nr:phosphoglucosamine mutase [Clostridia bacterium]
VGLAFDGDADRILAVDECGEVVDGDYIMAILALDMKERGRLYGNTVVGTVMTNLGFKKFCEERDIQFIAERVGDRYVLERMNRHGYTLGGEQSGHIILSEYATTGDGQLTALALMRCMCESGFKLSELKEVMRKYPQYMVNVSADAEAKRRFAEDGCISELLSDAEKEIEGGRLLVRVSGTEPKIRIMAEGDDVERVKRAVDALAARLEDVLR